MNLVDYVIANANTSFEDMPFNQVDGAVLTQACYLAFNAADVDTLGDLAASSHLLDLYQGTWNPQGNRRLIEAFHSSNRFGHIKWTEFVNVTDCAKQYQFSAVTYHLGNDLCFIAYRGTVASVIGWKEDLNMSFMKTIPSQKLATAYLMAVAKRNPDCQFILGGHSKGGNLAEYAASQVPDSLKVSVKKVYNLDGPGFRNGVISKKNINVLKMLPQNSVIGAILDESSDYQVVKSSKVGIRQHDLFTWQVAGDSFLQVSDVSVIAKGVGSLSSKVVAELDDSEKQFYLDELFKMIPINDNTYWREVMTTRNSWVVIQRFFQTDSQIKRRLLKMTFQFLAAVLAKDAAGARKRKVVDR